MSGQNLDFDFLARETLALTEQLRKESTRQSDAAFFLKDSIKDNFYDKRPEQFELDLFEDAFDFSNPEEGESFEEVQENEQPSVSGPGVIYKLEKGISTFCLRGIASSDMEWELEGLERRDKQLMKDLRLDEDFTSEDIRFFPTPDLAFAETLIDQLINRRFPRQEAIVCNISDPGFSWWLSLGENDLSLYFQSHGIERDEDLIQLGPLGDPFIAFNFFKRGLSFFKTQFAVREFSATEKGFSISSGASSKNAFEKLQKIFTHGEFTWDEEMRNCTDRNTHGLLVYFYELSLLRKFWFAVQDDLNN